MKNIITLILLTASTLIFAGDAPTVYSDQNSITKTNETPSNTNYTDDIYTEFANGSSEYQFQEMTNERIQYRIYKDMEAVCHNGLCTIFALKDTTNEFTTTFKVGYGPNEINSDEHISVYGGMVGLELKYTYKTCLHEVLVSTNTYIMIETYMAKMLKPNGDLVQSFPPSTTAVILFYATIMSNAKGCK